MIPNLLVSSHKGIVSLSLCDLEGLNVLAGKNNSGKSSILEAIALPGKVQIGAVITSHLIGNCNARFAAAAKSYLDNPKVSKARSLFSIFLENRKNSILYEREAGSFTSELLDFINSNAHSSFRSESLQLSECVDVVFEGLRAFMNFSGGPCLIPAKRLLDREGTLDFAKAAHFAASGSQMLSHLFFLKNQPVSSAEFEKYREVLAAFGWITDGLEFNLVPHLDGRIHLIFSDSWGNWHPAADCGLGLHDILVITAFTILSSSNIVMIEEPENHIHPDKQRRLLKFLSDFKNRQFFLSTHSNIFLDPSYVGRSFFVKRSNAGVEVEDRTHRTTLLKSLGYSISDNIGCDLIVLTEGPNDGPVLEELCKKLGFWEDYTIRFWPIGGDTMSRFDFRLIADSYDSKRILALIDSDPGSAPARKKFQANCDAAGIECIKLERYSIENYATLDVIRNCAALNQVVSIEELKPNRSTDSQLGFSIKKWMPYFIKSMSMEDLHGTDLLQFGETIRTRLISGA